MASFGPPPESNVLSYPGISGNRFDPISAQKCWAEVIKTEQNSGYVHRMLDGHGKLGLPQAWALDRSRRDGILPNYESIDEVYYMTGWKQNKFGASQQPDIRHLIPALRKAKKPKKERRHFDDDLRCPVPGMNMDYRPQSSAPSEARSQRSSTSAFRKDLKSASAPSLQAAAAPSPPADPPPLSRRLHTPALSAAALSQGARSPVALRPLGPKSQASSLRSSVLKEDRTKKIASLVCTEVASQCSEVMDPATLRF